METVTITLQEYEALKQQLIQKKRTESLWTREKRQLEKRVIEEFGEYRANQITDSIATIARRRLGRRTAVSFKESDIKMIWLMFESIIKAIKEAETRKSKGEEMSSDETN